MKLSLQTKRVTTPKEITVNDGSLKAKQPKRMVLNPIKGIIIFLKYV